MRLAIKVLLVVVGMAFLIAGLFSPRTNATTYGGNLTRVGSVTTDAQASDRDQSPADDQESAAEQEGRDDNPVTGAAAERAKAAAEAAVPGATVRGIERETNDDDTPRSAFEVELVRPNGSTVEVELDADYKVLSTDQEDDNPDD